MKERYRAWASLTATPQKRPAVVRLIDLPGVRDLENLEVLNSIARTKDDDRLAARINDVSRKHFGITEADTIFITEEALDQIKRRDPDEAYELENELREYERQFFCKPSRTVDGQADYLRKQFGWHVTDDNGRPMRLLERFARQIEAAEKKLCSARLPNFDSIKNQNWEEKMAEDARKFMSRKR